MELGTINKLFLELSQVATAKTARELELERQLDASQSVRKRVAVLEDLLTSAHAIAQRGGYRTSWTDFANRLAEFGIGSTTAKTFRMPDGQPAESALMPRELLEEINRALAKFPTWPSDALHALGVIGEEFGELSQAIVQLTYEQKGSPQDVRKEAIQLAVVVLRFLAGMSQYAYTPGKQHGQTITDHGLFAKP